MVVVVGERRLENGQRAGLSSLFFRLAGRQRSEGRALPPQQTALAAYLAVCVCVCVCVF
jgi:hypothetical protein